MTAHDFFVLTQHPTATAAPDATLELVFSQPVWDAPSNLEAIRLTADGVEVDADASVDGRYLRLTPKAALAAEAAVEVSLGEGFQSYGGRAVSGPSTATWAIAATPTLVLDGDYAWTVEMPIPDITTGEFSDQAVTTTVSLSVGGGAEATFDYGQDLTFSQRAVVSGDQVASGPLPIPIGPSFSDSDGFTGALTDDDGDGVGDNAAGVFTISGPGFVVEGVSWVLSRPSAADSCDVGDTGDTPPTIATQDDVVTIDWGDAANALGVARWTTSGDTRSTDRQ